MVSSLPSFDNLGSPEKPTSSVTHLCRSVKRTDSGSVLGNLSASWMPISSVSSQPNVPGIKWFSLQIQSLVSRRSCQTGARVLPIAGKFAASDPSRSLRAREIQAKILEQIIGYGLVFGFLGEVLIPFRYFNDEVARSVGHALAPQARLCREARSFVELIEFSVGRFVAGLEAFVHD